MQFGLRNFSNQDTSLACTSIMGHCVAKKSQVTISDDEESDPLNIETGSSKSTSDSSDEEEEELNEVAGKVLMTPPPTGVNK